MKMMKGRNLIVLLGIPTWLYLIQLGGYYYTFFILSIMIIGLQEFYELAEKKNLTPLRFIGFASAVFLADYFHVQPALSGFQLIQLIIFFVVAILFWELFRESEHPTLNISSTLLGILYVPLLLGTSIGIRQFDHNLNTNITFAFVISIWACDSAAFISGTLWGRKKIFPRVSPNKSWLGSIFGLLFSILVFVMFYTFNILGNIFSLSNAILMGLFIGVFGQVGDFIESSLKRDAGVKDSGKILLGHGGILDRFDSIIFSSPIIYIYIHTLF
tara:strand:+ start:834 stop:1649 length:816 start_codon:yes stop_codon:yes gene_type:complete